MATQKERELMLDLVNLAFEVNSEGNVCVAVEVKYYGIECRIYNHGSGGAWIYYNDSPAYFEDRVFTTEHYEQVIGEYIAEVKKHHPAYDSDGVKL